MEFNRFALPFLSILLLTSSAPKVSCGEGDVSFKAGYVFLDEEGNLAVNQESFNLYEGFNLSIEDLNYIMDNGISFNADLRNITLENRNLAFSSNKARLFALSFHDNKYRRIYRSDAGKSTKRETVGGSASFSPFKYARIFGGFNRVDKKGGDFIEFLDPANPITLINNYSHQSFNVGGQGYYNKTNVRLEYHTSDFSDEADETGSRKANDFTISAASAVPRLEGIILSGGYTRREDKLNNQMALLRTNQGWWALRSHLPKQIRVDYRLVFARTTHEGIDTETDNAVNTLSIGKIWRRSGGLRLAYENRISDDLTDRSESNGVLVNGWLNVRNRLFLRALLTTRSKDIATGSTLLGDEDLTRYRITATYSDHSWGGLTVQYQGRSKENPDIASDVDYRSLNTRLDLKADRYGNLIMSYGFYDGEFTNRSDSFEFSDHVFSVLLAPPEYKKLGVSAGGTYYRSRRDLDTEKFSLDLGAAYDMGGDYFIEAKYSAFNYDNYLAAEEFYTGNIVEVSLAKKISL